MNTLKPILIPLPCYGFDPTEAAIPWKLLKEKGLDIVFTTPNGLESKADTIMITGNGLGIWKSLLKARKDAVLAHNQMINSDAFKNPKKYTEIVPGEYSGLLLPGGHDKAVKDYLESDVLQKIVAQFFFEKKVIGAICHGLVLAARSISISTKRSVIYDYKLTSLLKTQELTAYNLTRMWLGDYYLTYPGLTVEDEVKSVLSESSNFIKGKTPIWRDRKGALSNGFSVVDRNFVSARWPGDIYNFTDAFIKLYYSINGSGKK